MGGIVDRNGEHKHGRVVGNDKNGPGRNILPWNHAMEIDQRETLLHSESKAAVVLMVGVGTPVPVAKQPVWSKGVILGTLRGCGDREGYLPENSWLEDALRAK